MRRRGRRCISSKRLLPAALAAGHDPDPTSHRRRAQRFRHIQQRAPERIARVPRSGSSSRTVSRWAASVLAAAGIAVVVSAAPAGAHPLGNFTVNTATALTVTDSVINVTLVVDMAEIPALQAKQRMDQDGDKEQSGTERAAYRTTTCEGLIADLSLRVDGRALSLALGRTALSFPPGQAGLTTLRLECDLRAPVTIDRRVSVALQSTAFADRVGWREVTAAADSVTFGTSDVPVDSPSDTLTNYPASQLQSPPRQDRANLTVSPGGPALVAGGSAQPASPLPRGIDGPTRAFASFVGRHDLSVGVGLVAVALSLVLGAIHALAPGHGKTVMAAYLVGQKGSVRQAAALGLTVTATHTLGVLALGIAIAASKIVNPERLYPYLGAVSGLLLAAIGFSLLRNARRVWRIDRRHPATVRPASRLSTAPKTNTVTTTTTTMSTGTRTHTGLPPTPAAATVPPCW